MKKLNKKVMENVLTKVAMGHELNEDEMFILQAHYGLVEDKDQKKDKAMAVSDNHSIEAMLTKEMVSYLNKVGMKHTRKMVLKDKAKHGYHKGSARMGWGHYDRFLKPERLAKDISKDIKTQLDEAGIEDDIPLMEGVNTLYSVFAEEISGYNKGVKSLYYRCSEDWKDLNESMPIVQRWVNAKKDELNTILIQAWKELDSLYPEMGEGWKQEVHHFFKYCCEGYISSEAEHMTSYIRMCYRDYWEAKKVEAEMMLRKLEK